MRCVYAISVGSVGLRCKGNTSTSIGSLVKWKDERKGNWSMGTARAARGVGCREAAMVYDGGPLILPQLPTIVNKE